LTVEHMCALGEVSRSGWYRYRSAEQGGGRDAELRAEVRTIALEWPCYGSRRVARELRDRGWTVNRKRVQHWMRGFPRMRNKLRRYRATGHRRFLTLRFHASIGL